MGYFATTSWSLVHKAAGDAAGDRRDALQELLTRYMPAMRAHLIQRRRLGAEQADELVQAFVLKNMLEGELLQRADQTGGKFRSWVLKWLENYVRHELSRKRREVAVEQMEESPEAESVDAFEIEWARRTLDEALQMMKAECEVSGKTDRWEVFEARLIAPLLGRAEPTEFDELVERLDLNSAAQAQNLLVTAKRHFTRTLETVVGRYADSQAEITGELRELRQLLAAATAQPTVATSVSDAERGPACEARPEQVARFLDLDCRQVWSRCLLTPVAKLLDEPPTGEPTAARITLGELLHAKAPDLELLQALKRLGNAQMQEGSDELPAEISLAVYLLPIAAARVRMNQDISSVSIEMLESAFQSLAAAEWLDEASQQLVTQTLDR